MSDVYLENIPKVTHGVNYEGQVKSAMQKIIDRVEETTNRTEILRASIEVKKVFKTALSKGPKDKTFQKRISNLFCEARETLGSALMQVKVVKK